MKKYKCPICKIESVFKGVCPDCNEMYTIYKKAFVEKDIWFIERISSRQLVAARRCKDIYEKAHKHYQKLEKRRKYTPGECIRTFEELLSQEFVCMYKKPKHISFIKSMQVKVVHDLLSAGQFSLAIKKEVETDETINN